MEDPSALPLYATLVLSALMYPLGLFWTSGCCDKCIKVGCFLDPRGYWEQNSFDEDLGYPMAPETYLRCRRQCAPQELYKTPVEQFSQLLPSPGPGCSQFKQLAVPDWQGVIGCRASSAATQLEVTISGAQANEPPLASELEPVPFGTIQGGTSNPTGADLRQEMIDAYQDYAAAINTTVVFDLDCTGAGGCIPLAAPIVVPAVSLSAPGFGGAQDRTVTRSQVQPLLTAAVEMKQLQGVDCSSITLQLMSIYETFYVQQVSGLGTLLFELDEAKLGQVPQDKLGEPAYLLPNLSVTYPSGLVGCARTPSTGRDVFAPPISLNWAFGKGPSLAVLADGSGPIRLHAVTITAPFGSGAHFEVAQPQTSYGPLAAVEKVSGGSGYASVGRREPTLAASSIPGIAITATLSQGTSDDGRPVWSVASCTAKKSGSYSVASTSAQVRFAFEAETQFARDEDGNFIRPAATLQFTRAEPQLAVTIIDPQGSGAELEPVLQQISAGGAVSWTVSSVTVLSPGSNYTQFASVKFTIPENVVVIYMPNFKATVQDGEIESVTANVEAFPFFANAGSLYALDIDGITVQNGGQFFKEDKSLAPLEANVTVSVKASAQNPSNTGSGAELSAVVDTKYGSATFGQITGLQIDKAGSNYRAWTYLPNFSAMSTDGCAVEPAVCNSRVFSKGSFPAEEWPGTGPHVIRGTFSQQVSLSQILDPDCQLTWTATLS